MMHNIPPAKYFLTAVLALVIAAPMSCLFLYQVRICFNRFEMLERLEQESLHSLTLSSTDVHWVIPGKEIRIEGRLFDLKNISQKENAITVTGIFDEEEEELERMISRRSDPDANKLPILVKLLSSPVIKWDASAYFPFTTFKPKPKAKRYSPRLSFFFMDPQAPPPRRAA